MLTSKSTGMGSRRLLKLLAALLAFAMLAAACGDDDDTAGSEDDTETTEDTTAADETDTTEAEEDTTESTEAMDEEEDEGAMAADSANVVTLECGAEGGSFEQAASPVTDLSVAIVAPSASADLAFTQSMVDAVTSMGIEPQITDGTFVVEEAAAAIRGYAEDGVDVVIAHGTQYGGSLVEIAPDFPETSFLWGTSSDTQGLDNVFAYTPAADEGGYVMGLVAAAISETGTIGMVGPIDTGDAALFVDGFEAGAEDGGASVNTSFTGSFGDTALATEAATAHLEAGADVLTGTAQHVVGAINVASANDIPWFGTQSNQTSLAPDLVVASQVYHWEVVLADIFANIEAGTLGGEVYEINLANNGLVIEFNGCYELSDDAKATAIDTAAGIADGSIDTGVEGA